MVGFILALGIVIIVIVVVVSLKNQSVRGETILSMKISLENSGFTVSKQVTDSDNNYAILIDDIHHQWTVIEARTGKSTSYYYADLIEYEVLEDGDSVVKGRVGSVVVGGLLF